MGWNLVGTIPGAPGSGGINVRPVVTPGLAVYAVASLAVAILVPGAAVSIAPVTITVPTTTGATVTTSAMGATQTPQTPAIQTAATMAQSHTETPALELVQATYSLTARNGSNAATSTGADAWPNIANAQGRTDGTTANAVGNALAARSFTARMAYAAQNNKTALTITACELRYYFNHTSVLNNATRTLRATWTGGSYTSGGISTSLNASTTPVTVDVFALGVTDWTKANSLVSFVDLTTTLGAVTGGLNLDAVELVITASLTETL